MLGTSTRYPKDPDGKTNIHSFIIRIWLVGLIKKKGRNHWRGRITHIPGDEQKYFTDLDEIMSFINLYLKEQGKTDDTH